MGKIKLLEVITELELGGAQLSTLDLISGLDKNIYDIYLITSDQGILVKEASLKSQIKLHLLASLKREINILCDLKALFFIFRFIKREEIDIVHTHSSKAGIIGRWAAKLAGVKVIVHTVHGWEFHQYQSKIMKYLFIFLEKITAAITDKIIALTNHDIKKGINCGIGKRNKYSLIRLGIDREKFEQEYNGSFRKCLGIDENCFVVGMIACFKPQKNPLDFIISAAGVKREITNVKFIMVGDGKMRKKIVGLIKRLGMEDRFVLLGWQRNIPQILSSFDVLVLPSLWEGAPLVFLEAMARKKPIVANDIDGNAEVIKDGVNGFLVKPRDTYSLSERIIYLFKNSNLASQMGENGRNILCHNFNLNRMVDDVHNLYLLSLKQKGHSRW